jgi:hypothetical protein
MKTKSLMLAVALLSIPTQAAAITLDFFTEGMTWQLNVSYPTAPPPQPLNGPAVNGIATDIQFIFYQRDGAARASIFGPSTFSRVLVDKDGNQSYSNGGSFTYDIPVDTEQVHLSIFTECIQLSCNFSPTMANISYSPTGVMPPLATPLPATLPLFLTGLGLLGLVGWRRKRKAA